MGNEKALKRMQLYTTTQERTPDALEGLQLPSRIWRWKSAQLPGNACQVRRLRPIPKSPPAVVRVLLRKVSSSEFVRMQTLSLSYLH